MANCPKCGRAKTTKPMKVLRFVCSSCGTSYVAWMDSKTGEVKTMARKD